MKVKLSKKQIDAILADPDKARQADVSVNDPWWVIVLKVLAYLIGLLLAGACTTFAARAAGLPVEAIVDSIALM